MESINLIVDYIKWAAIEENRVLKTQNLKAHDIQIITYDITTCVKQLLYKPVHSLIVLKKQCPKQKYQEKYLTTS